MKYLEYTTPLRASSREEISVKDRNDKELLSLQRFYKNRFELILAALKPRIFTNIKVKENSETVVKSKDIFTLGRSKWDIEIKENDKTIRMKDISVVSTHPRAEFEVEGHQYKVTHNFGERTTTVYSEEENTIAELKYEKKIPTKHNSLRILESELDTRLLLCVLHTFEEAQ
ncbi:hypothetical protein FH966_04465 [Lentibacillus cibarius]|uniref:Tubby C-terminal domain-containing protein n=1 Tax=Lentibacillus cibarius TaxID=2583219 RepID=A0A549YGQ3_9BACI|nr:hypothetical protein [Lentibacillus cibarius]TRM11038.1 hypothetical protein FH966_04465 [Lentibacillus cibarius]